jgi:hypothetical protein
MNKTALEMKWEAEAAEVAEVAVVKAVPAAAPVTEVTTWHRFNPEPKSSSSSGKILKLFGRLVFGEKPLRKIVVGAIGAAIIAPIIIASQNGSASSQTPSFEQTAETIPDGYQAGLKQGLELCDSLGNPRVIHVDQMVLDEKRYRPDHNIQHELPEWDTAYADGVLAAFKQRGVEVEP